MKTTLRRWRTPAVLILVATAMQGTATSDDRPQQQQNEFDDFGRFPQYDENSPEARFEAICNAWRYPESDGSLGGGGAGTSADEDGLIPAIWKFTWRSKKPYADVWNFYAEKCRHQETFDEDSYGVWTGRHDGGFYVVDDRLWLPNADLLYSTFVYNAPAYVATVMLRPPTDERGTYINLSIASRADAVEFGDDDSDAATGIESGDPRDLSLDEVRALRDTLLRVTVPRTDGIARPEDLMRGPFEGRSERLIQHRHARVRYDWFDDYMAIREAEAFHDLGLRAWTVNFTGGPLQLWYEVETRDDVPLPDLLLREQTQNLAATLITHASEGRLMFWCLPLTGDQNNSPRSQAIMKLLHQNGSELKAIPHFHGIHVVNGPETEFSSTATHVAPPLWAGWSNVRFRRHSPAGPLLIKGETALLDIEATETGLDNDSRGRSLRLKLMARPVED